jgi:hypothetical protein
MKTMIPLKALKKKMAIEGNWGEPVSRGDSK